MISNKAYDILKWLALIALPAFAVLIGGLGQVWGWPDADKITLTVNLVAVFIGSLIGVSTVGYRKSGKDDDDDVGDDDDLKQYLKEKYHMEDNK